VAGWGCIRVSETPKHIETRIHNQCGDKIEKSQAPDDGCVMKGNFGIIFGKRNVTQEPGRLISFLLLP